MLLLAALDIIFGGMEFIKSITLSAANLLHIETTLALSRPGAISIG